MSKSVNKPLVKSPRGLYLVEPHGRLIYDGRKTSIAKSKHISLSGDWVIVSKEQGVGLGYGVAQVGESRVVDIDTFDSEFESHRVTLRERTKWWPDATELYLWPIRSFDVYPTPKRVRVPPGTKTIMDEVSYIPDTPGDAPDIEPGQDRERPYTETGRPRQGDESGELTKEVNMPWTMKDPPSCAKNWTESEKKKCITAANAVLREGGKEQDAIFACIHAAGKTEHPGGESDESKKAQGEGQGVDGPRQGTGGPDHCICPECGELVVHEPGTPCTDTECPKCGAQMKPKPESESTKKDIPRDTQETTRAREVSATMTRLKGLFDGDLTTEQLTIMSENLVNLKVMDPDTGEDSPQICVCPQCGFSSEQLPNAPCSKMGCPKCGTAMKPQEDVEPPDEPPGDSPGETTKSRIAQFLDNVVTSTKSILGINVRDPLANNAIGYKVEKSRDGRTWLILSAVNAFEDREGEIFTTKAINEYVDAQEDKPKKGELWFWHMPGTKFADITWQGVSGRFLYEAGPFDDTVAGKVFEKFFVTHPQGHIAVASRGWGASHGFIYHVKDREDAVFNWFDKMETSVLPFEYASNPHNAALEVMMNTKQLEALRAIGGDALVEHVIKAGEERTKELEGHVAFKGVPPVPDLVPKPAEGTEPAESTKSKKYQMSALERRELALDMSEILQLGELSRVVSAQTEVLSQLAEKMKANDEHMDDIKTAVDTRITAVERSDEEKLAERQLSLPRYAWFRASAAPETSMARAAEALKERHPGIPGAVSTIVDKLTS